MSAVAPDQLLHLVGRAERRVISAAEAEVLRDGVTRLLAQLSLVGGTVSRLSEELRQARSERNAALMELALVGPEAVECSFCGAEVGERCGSLRGVMPPRTPHTARLHAAARLGEQR